MVYQYHMHTMYIWVSLGVGTAQTGVGTKFVPTPPERGVGTGEQFLREVLVRVVPTAGER